MSAQQIEIKPSKPLSTDQQRVIQQVIASGLVLIFPTDTIYGLGCDAFNATAVSRVAEIKGRISEHPFSVHLGAPEEVEEYSILEPKQLKIVEKFLPGPYTFLLKASRKAPKPCVASDGKIGIRIPNSTSFVKIYSVLDKPLVGTSVNLAGLKPLNNFDEIFKIFSEKVDLIIKTTEAMSFESSAVIDLTTHPPIAIRGQLPDSLLL